MRNKVALLMVVSSIASLIFLMCVDHLHDFERQLSTFRRKNLSSMTMQLQTNEEPREWIRHVNSTKQMRDTLKKFADHPKKKIYRSPEFGPARWASMPGEVLDVYVLSAFLDDRWQGYVKPVISVLAALHNNPETVAMPSHINCICQCSDIDQRYAIPTKIDERSHGSSDNTFYGKRFGSYVIMCDVQQFCVPDRIMLSYARNTLILTVNNSVLVEYPEQEMKYDFGLCVPISFGDIDPYRLIEWIEFQKILGVSWVGIYDAGLGNATRYLLQHYQNEKFVFMNRNKAILFPGNRDELRIRCSIAITDCLYRHMYTTKYVAVSDFDEAIVPTRHFTLKGMLSEIETLNSNENIVEANFRNTFFILDDLILEKPSDDSAFNHSTFLKYRFRLDDSPDGCYTKSIINPRGCTLMHNHYCHCPVHSYRTGAPEHRRYSVPTVVGRNLHYRHDVCRRTSSAVRCFNHISPNVTHRDDVMLKYQAQLVPKIEEALMRNGIS